ncbi:MAG: class I SAM-dependent methyltransferase [Chitinophagales bacterium]
MIKRRQDREIYFKEQDYTTATYVVPYISQYKSIDSTIRVLEIGCGEGGNMKYFVDKGCEVVGIDLNEKQLERAQVFLESHCDDTSKLTLLFQDIYDTDTESLGKFDVIMMRDVIEHIPNQNKFLAFLKNFTKDDGLIFFGFPPWYMPFGGHQQGCDSVLRKTPYFHILPTFLYRFILKIFGEPQGKIDSLLQTKSTGISIERFKKCARVNDWKILDETLYFINPNYDVKFKLKPRKQNWLFGRIPFFRNFVSTCAYYIITPKSK